MNWPAARRIVFALVLGALAAWAFLGMQGGATLAVGTRIEDLSAELDDGRIYRLGRRDGEVLVLNFWATWCGPCRKEAPILSGLHGGTTTVVGIAIEDLPLETLRQRARALGARYPVGVDRTGLMRRFNVRVVPTTYVIASDGVVVFGRTGLARRDELEEAIAEARARRR